MKYALLAATTLALLCGTALADPIDPQYVKWSQLPDMTANGYDFSSETLVPSLVADDFLCDDIRPITDIHWWGSYYTSQPYDMNSDHHTDPSFAVGTAPVMPNVVSGFVITFYSDIPAGIDPNMPYSHPGQVLCSSFVGMSQVATNLQGVIDRNSDGIIGNDGDEAVWQYNVLLDNPFEQIPGTIYWISIQAVNNIGNSIQWGWHESFEHWNDTAVQQGPAALWGLPYSVDWANLEVKDMAFELSIPEPATMALLGGGLAIMGFSRKRGRR